jgi:hypothetical protein
MARTKKLFPYTGRWAAKDRWQTDIAFTISKRGNVIKIRAADLYDGEEAEIYGIKANRDGLFFAAYWSTGRFTKYRLRCVGDDEMEIVFTHTETTHFERVKGQPAKS